MHGKQLAPSADSISAPHPHTSTAHNLVLCDGCSMQEADDFNGKRCVRVSRSPVPP